jgi:hypothetical protein
VPKISEIASGFVDRMRRGAGNGGAVDQPSLFPAGTHRAVLVTILGVEKGRIEDVIDRALSVLSGHDAVVFLTDQPDFLPFRRRQVPFEYLPPAALRSGDRPPVEWRRYLSARYELLIAKWHPEKVVSYGTTVAKFIGGPEKQSDSVSG